MSIDDIAQDATVAYTKGERTYEKILSAMLNPKDSSHPHGREGEMLMLIANAYKQGWKDGLIARLSGVKGE